VFRQLEDEDEQVARDVTDGLATYSTEENDVLPWSIFEVVRESDETSRILDELRLERCIERQLDGELSTGSRTTNFLRRGHVESKSRPNERVHRIEHFRLEHLSMPLYRRFQWPRSSGIFFRQPNFVDRLPFGELVVVDALDLDRTRTRNTSMRVHRRVTRTSHICRFCAHLSLGLPCVGTRCRLMRRAILVLTDGCI
jgi:hypothetical protein